MAIRVAQIATGNAGAIALRHLIEDPRFELVGVWVHSADKAGRDAGELAGLGVDTGVTATTSAADIVAAAPDCVVYCAMSDTRPVEAARDIREYLAAGINVAGTAPTPLINPAAGVPDSARAKLEAAALEGGATLFVTGVVAGEPVIVVEHVTRTRDDLRPDWPYAVQEGHSYRVEVIGEPSYVLDLAAQSADGDHNYSAILAGVGRVVNAVPAVVAAAPGLTTTLDLPLTGAPGIVGTR
jgi:hypothetical protein